MRRRADRMTGWSIGWTILSLLLWGWFTILLVADYGPSKSSFRGGRECPSLVREVAEYGVCTEDVWHQWPALLGILALTVLATIVAAATTVYGKALTRLAALSPSSAPGERQHQEEDQ